MKHRRVRRAKPFVRRKGRAARSAAGHHRYAQQAFAAGRADRLAGRPENRFYTAGPYASSYRLGVHARAANPRRKKQTRRRPLKGKVVTTVSHSKVVRRTNPRHVLYATKPGHPRLKYLGHGKFGEKGRAQLFGSVAEGNAVGRALREAFPAVLRGWIVTAGAEAPESTGRHAQRRRLTRGTDPADTLYRDKVRADAERAHRWLAKQAK